MTEIYSEDLSEINSWAVRLNCVVLQFPNIYKISLRNKLTLKSDLIRPKPQVTCLVGFGVKSGYPSA